MIPNTIRPFPLDNSKSLCLVTAIRRRYHVVTSTPGLRYRFSGVAETYKILVSNATMITDTWDVDVPILQRFSVSILR